MSAIIEFKDVHFKYPEDELESLCGITLAIEEGSFVAVLGHNGSGKSTLAKHMNAILTPTSGQVLVNGLDTADENRLLDVRRTVGMVFQNPDNQIIGQVVEEDVAFGPENMGVPTAEIRRRVDEALAVMGMEKYAKGDPNRLSGGQKQRVSIAGVIAMRPKCLILDEPTAMLDPQGRREVIDAAMRLNREEQITVILITHHMEEVIPCDHVFVMDKGEVVMEGSPREVFSRVDELERLRLTAPQATLLAHALKQEGLPLPDGVLTDGELAEHLSGILRET